MNYYCLIAGLPDIGIEDNKLTFSIADFKEEVRLFLSKSDKRLIDLFYMKFDNQNILKYLKDKDVQFDERGNLSKSEMEDCFQLINDGSKAKNKCFKSYFANFVSEYSDAEQEEGTDDGKWENRLTELYYKWAKKCGNKFISSWFEYNLDLNNILAAYTSRKYKMNLEVIGDNEVAESIKMSKLRDFGLTETFEDFDLIQRLAEETDLYEREKKIDLMKWQWIEDKTFFKYFTIELIFAYLLKLEIIERWVRLDPIEGEKLFRSLIDSLKDSVVNMQKNEV